jgi:hypothetical protein
MAVIPDNTRRLVESRLRARASERWPQLRDVTVRTRAGFAYVQGTTTEGEELSLCRLRYLRSASEWGFAVYLASKDGYEDSVLPTGSFTASAEEALDCACGLYLNDPTGWLG